MYPDTWRNYPDIQVLLNEGTVLRIFGPNIKHKDGIFINMNIDKILIEYHSKKLLLLRILKTYKLLMGRHEILEKDQEIHI